MRKTMQVSLGWGYQVTPPVKPCQTSNCVPFPLPYETQESLILLKMQECFVPCFFTALWHNMKSGVCSSVTFPVIDIAPGWHCLPQNFSNMWLCQQPCYCPQVSLLYLVFCIWVWIFFKDIIFFLFGRKEAFYQLSKNWGKSLNFFPQCIFCAKGETLILFQEGIQEYA